uniref:Raptor N-terminal CASPase-like domain-containing protein n=1 Tax=Lactuca sativa TaxID=4236 RepID=A0A9R1VE77_LACSA|nr:hypothetical protein LSAT_V11C500256990 [Lactuca sativa]
MKTGCVALVLCLNISVDPPDVIKISPCARIISRLQRYEKNMDWLLSKRPECPPQKKLSLIGGISCIEYSQLDLSVSHTSPFQWMDM